MTLRICFGAMVQLKQSELHRILDSPSVLMCALSKAYRRHRGGRSAVRASLSALELLVVHKIHGSVLDRPSFRESITACSAQFGVRRETKFFGLSKRHCLGQPRPVPDLTGIRIGAGSPSP